MTFVKVPDDLPSPQAYLRAGLTRPTISVSSPRWAENVVTDGNPPSGPVAPEVRPSSGGGRTVTVTDADGSLTSLTEERSSRFLTRPARRWASRSEIHDMHRDPSGVLFLEVGARRPVSSPEHPPPPDPETARVVTIDHSVLVAGLDPALFGPDDAIFVSVAIALELAVAHGERPSTDELFTEYGDWNLSTPVPIDHYVLRNFAEMSTRNGRSLLGPGQLDRTDLLCAATAVLYDAPLYTTKRSAYAGLGLGLKVIQYGARRNTSVAGG